MAGFTWGGANGGVQRSGFASACRQWVALALVGVAAMGAAVAQEGMAHKGEAREGGARDSVDSMAWRVKACSACHGDQGRATADGYFPRLAGKPAGYLFQQLQNFRDGRRSHPQMAHLLAYLSDDYLREMADYFAKRQVPYPPPARTRVSAQELARGQALVLHGDASRGLPACVACHGAAMTGVLPAVPGLLGLSRDYLNSQLGAWQTGQRHAQAPDCMADIARKLSVAEVAAVAGWLAAMRHRLRGQPVAQLPRPAPLTCAGMAQTSHGEGR